jgi:Fe-S cluster assembly protein SufD
MKKEDKENKKNKENKEKIGLNRINVVRIEDDSKEVLINIDNSSVNVIMVTNNFSRKIKMNCGKNSKTKYIEINNSKIEKSTNEIQRNLILQKSAKLNFYNLYAGKGNQKSETTAELGENSDLSVRNIFISENQEHNHDLIVIHKEKNSKSDLQSRGILSSSKINLKGLIKIEEKAEDSEGYQKSDLLILNDSEAVSIPDLEIKNNKVKCSHGSSITRLDKEKIFYLQTRGVDEKNAKIILMNAFFNSIFQDLEQNEAEELSIIVDNKLNLMAK